MSRRAPPPASPPATEFTVSVVIPARNREATLAACLDSVLGQTLPPTEVIVVDDASTDATAELVLAYADRGVRLLRQQTAGGAQAARNAGIRAAACEWIALQDSDDVWLPLRLERQIAALRDLAALHDIAIHADGLVRTMPDGPVEALPIPKFAGDCYSELLLTPGPMFQGMLVRRVHLERIGLLDEACPAYQEWDTAIRLARICRWVHLREPLFEWRRQQGTPTISDNTVRSLAGYRYVVEKHRDEIVRVHGRRAHHLLVVGGLVQALRAGLYDEVLRIAEGEHSVLASVARTMARTKFCPRGTGRLFRLLALATFRSDQ